MKIPISILGVMATAAIVTTACSVPQTMHDSGPSPAACTQGPGAPPCPGGAGVWRPSNADSAIFAAQRFGAERIDTVAAHAALESGKPVLVGLPDGGNDACHTLLLVPGDVQPWILNTSAVSSAGRAMDRTLLTYGCGAGMKIPTPRVPVPVPVLPLDEAAKTEAAAAGKPFVYATCAGAAVVLPDGAHGGVWHLNRHGGATVTGETLSRDKNLAACGGYGAPGGVR